MPGYGQSQMGDEQPTGLDVQGEIFAFMLDQWGLSKTSVIAHDFGGATTLRAHLLHNCEYDRYVLMNVVAMRPWGSAFFDHVGRHIEAFLGLPQHIHEAVLHAYINGALANDLEPGDIDALAKPWLSEAGRKSFYRQFALADERFTAEIEPVFGDLRCRCLILWGARDPWIPLDRGQALHATMPTSRFETLSGLGHLPQLEGPDTVLRALRDFLLDWSLRNRTAAVTPPKVLRKGPRSTSFS